MGIKHIGQDVPFNLGAERPTWGPAVQRSHIKLDNDSVNYPGPQASATKWHSPIFAILSVVLHTLLSELTTAVCEA